MDTVLFIGNSYTYYNDLPGIFSRLASENGHEIQVDAVTKGARKLVQYQNAEDPYTEKLVALLGEKHYSVAVLQEQSVLPLTGEKTFLNGVEYLTGMLSGKADRILLYQTWARKAGHETLIKNGWTVDQMAKGLRDAYRRVADAVGASVSPAGDAFAAFLAAYPALELYDPDGTHPSYLGSALAAVVHYASIFGELPASLSSLALDEKTLDALIFAAGAALKKQGAFRIFLHRLYKGGACPHRATSLARADLRPQSGFNPLTYCRRFVVI